MHSGSAANPRVTSSSGNPAQIHSAWFREPQLAGNNGIEISLDEKEFYVVSFGTHTVVAFSRQDPRKPLRQSVAPGFMPDNLRWSGNRLIATGPMYDEPACGGTRLGGRR